MEIEFFGVIGTSSEDNIVDSSSNMESPVQINNVFSNYDLELKIIN